MRKEIRALMEQREKYPASTHLTFDAVRNILGKSQRTVSRLLAEGRLTKIGKGRGSRIPLDSVLRYLDEVEKRAKDVAVVSAAMGVNLAKGRALLRKKQQEDRLKRALEKVEASTPANPNNPEGDPRLEACTFEGVCMSVADREDILQRREWAARARRLGWQSVRGV